MNESICSRGVSVGRAIGPLSFGRSASFPAIVIVVDEMIEVRKKASKFRIFSPLPQPHNTSIVLDTLTQQNEYSISSYRGESSLLFLLLASSKLTSWFVQLASNQPYKTEMFPVSDVHTLSIKQYGNKEVSAVPSAL